MNFKSLLPLAALAFPLIGLARPASPLPVQYKNPDGTTTMIRIFGDEDFSYTTDESASFLMELDSKGFWQKAVRNGLELKLNEANIELLRAEKPLTINELKANTPSGQSRMAPIDKDGRSLFPTKGNDVHSPVVLIEFEGTPFTYGAEQFEKLLNSDNYSDFRAHGSVREYYAACSNGQFTPTFDVYGPIKVSHTSEWYVAANTDLPTAGKYGRFGYALEEALTILKEQGADFSKYDYDEDGVIDSIYFFYSGYGQADTGDRTTVWPHQGQYSNFTYSWFLGLEPFYFGDKLVDPYACSNELNGYKIPGFDEPTPDGIGAFCHEFGHVLGLPDLYDAQAQAGLSSVYTKTPDRWSVMDSGTYNDYGTCPPLFSVYEQWVCNWIDPYRPEDGEHISLNPIVDEDRNTLWLRVRRNTAAEQYAPTSFYIENRVKKGWDEYLPDEGMLVWRVKFDRNKWIGNKVNTGGNPNVEILGADEARRQMTYPGPAGTYTYIYPGTSGYPAPGINTPYYNCFITSIEQDPETKVISFDYNLTTTVPEEITVLHDNPVRDETGARRFKLTWDPVEGADGYLLTVKRYDSSGRAIIVNNLNETNVGTATEYIIDNLSTAAFKQRFEASVRVNKVIPSANTSNLISFIPAELTMADLSESGIEDVILDDFFAYGLKGRIEAPEGARVFSLSGIETGTEDLAPGIYLVRLGQQVRKVAVR